MLVAVSVLAAYQAGDLRVHVSPRSLTLEDDPGRAFYERSVATFGSDNVTIIYVGDPDLVAPEKLAAVRDTVARLEALEFVDSTRSLFSVPNLRVEDEYVKTDPYLGAGSISRQETEEVFATALKNPFVKGNLLAEDGTALAINVTIAKTVSEAGADTRIAMEIDQAIAPLRSIVETAFQIGLPVIRTEISDQIRHDQRTIMPVAMLVLLVTLAIGFRRVNGAVIPLLTSSLSILWTLALMAFLAIPLNVMTAIVPVLLIIVGSTEDVHLVAEYYDGMRGGLERRAAIRFMARRVGLAVLLTFFTSCLGFLSVASSPVELLREFGLVAAFGLFVNICITVLLVPAYLRLLGDRRRAGDMDSGAYTAPVRVSPFTSFALSHGRLVLAISLVTAIAAAVFSLNIRVNNNVLDYFGKDTTIRQQVDRVHRDLSGIETFSVIVDGHIDGTFLKVRYLNDLKKLRDFIANHAAFDFAVSFADYLTVLNSVVNETGEPELPDEDEVVGELMLFVTHDKVKEYVSHDFSRASIVVRHNVGSSYRLRHALADLYTFARENLDEGLQVQATGETILTNNAADYMASSQAKSLALMILVIFLVISLLFVNARAGLLAIVPNLFPILVLFGVMGYVGIPLDTGTAMIAAIAVGICVDHTMHFMVRYNRKLREQVTADKAIRATIHEELTPISAVTASLAAGFATLAFSGFSPVVYFGLLSALVMVTAYYANFFITPLLLTHIRLVTLWDLLSIDLRRDLVNHCPLFSGMKPDQIKRVILLGRVVEFAPGGTVMARGDPSTEIYIVLRGAVRLQGMDTNANSESYTLRIGGVFGLLALVCGRDRVATATVVEESTVLCLDWSRIQRVARYHPRTAALLFQNLSTIIGQRFMETMSERDAAGNNGESAPEHIQQQLQPGPTFSQESSQVENDAPRL